MNAELPRNLTTAGSTPVERMYFAWNDALSRLAARPQ